MTNDEALALLKRLCEMADGMSRGSGEPGTELLGLIVSEMVGDPKFGADVLERGTSALIDSTQWISQLNGVLTIRTVGGETLHPAVAESRRSTVN